MQSDLLLEEIKTTLHKTKATKLANIAAQAGYSIKHLIDLTFYHNEKIAFRASWILETICLTNFERFLPQIHYFLDKFPQQQNLSCRRHYSKILALITKKNAPQIAKEIVEKHDTETLVETVFSWLIDDKNPVAIKAHCLNILANLTLKHVWIKEELIETMDFLVDKESIAFHGRVKQVRKQLK
ncbi:hypothetical protein ACHMWN_15660 [Pedobacter sp. UC225_61]|uniref:hypothetical protein n=1 Tax=Pedobacter sp. UC225_61 TaxID=3374623 RepID=UPI00378CD29D